MVSRLVRAKRVRNCVLVLVRSEDRDNVGAALVVLAAAPDTTVSDEVEVADV